MTAAIANDTTMLARITIRRTVVELIAADGTCPATRSWRCVQGSRSSVEHP
jgi:hypothetical protein